MIVRAPNVNAIIFLLRHSWFSKIVYFFLVYYFLKVGEAPYSALLPDENLDLTQKYETRVNTSAK